MSMGINANHPKTIIYKTMKTIWFLKPLLKAKWTKRNPRKGNGELQFLVYLIRIIDICIFIRDY